MKEKVGILNDNIVISLDNLEELSKIIALSAIKGFKKYSFNLIGKVEKLHKQLQYDICYHKPLEVYSDAYDLVQEASLFLCKFIGHKLGELCINSKSKSGRTDNLKNACLRVLQVYLRKELKFHNNITDENECFEVIDERPIIEDKPDYTKVKEVISKIIQNRLELQIFEYYYNGVEPKLIAEFLNISADKVYKQRRKFKDRYAMYNM